MERAPAGPEGRACRAWLLDLPEEELLCRILGMVEDAYVGSRQTSAKFLALRTVCKRFQRSVDSMITNLSRGIARKFCRGERLDQVEGNLRSQLARWGSVRRVELHIRGSNCALTRLLPTLAQSSPGLTALHIERDVSFSGAYKTCPGIQRLSFLTSLTSLSLTGFDHFTATLPPLPSLRTLTAEFFMLTCPSPLPALETLVCGQNERPLHEDWWCLEAPHLHTSSRLRHFSLRSVLVHELRLPRSLQTLDVINISLTLPLDLGTELPELAEVRIVDDGLDPNPIPVAPQGLATLLSRSTLRQLTLHGLSGVTSLNQLPLTSLNQLPLTSLNQLPLTSLNQVPLTSLNQLPLAPGLTPLSHRSPQLQPACLHEGIARLTTLELDGMEGLRRLDISHLRLQHLKLKYLHELSSIEGLELQTQLTSLVLHELPLITHLPDLRSLRSLGACELTNLGLKLWSPDNCSGLPRLKLLHIENVGDFSPPVTSAAVARSGMAMLDLGSLASLTELTLSRLPISEVDLSQLSLIEKVEIRGCCQLSHLSGLHSLPRLHTFTLLDSSPELHSLTVSSCPSLSTFSCYLEHLRHLKVENVPGRYSCSGYSFRVITRTLKSPTLAGLPLWEDFEFRGCNKLTRLQLINLPQCSRLVLDKCQELQSVVVSGCPLTALTLQDLPQLRAPNLHVDTLLLHAPNSTTPPATSSAAPHRLSNSRSSAEPEASCTHPASLKALHDYPGVSSLTLGRLPGLFSLEHIALQSGQASLEELRNLEEFRIPLCVTELTFSEPKLASLDVSQLAFVQKLTVDGCASLTRLPGITSLPHLTCLELTSLPKLEKLAILSCPKLKYIWFFCFSPQHLHLEDLPSLRPENFGRDVDEKLGFSGRMYFGNFCRPLQSLTLRRVPDLIKLILKDLEKLESLEVAGCSSLVEVHLEKLASLTSLRLEERVSEPFDETNSSSSRSPYPSGCIESLSILHMPKLQSIPCLSTLRSLSVGSCSALTSLPLDNLPHLVSVKLRDVPDEVFPTWFQPFRGLQHMEFDRPSSNKEA